MRVPKVRISLSANNQSGGGGKQTHKDAVSKNKLELKKDGSGAYKRALIELANSRGNLFKDVSEVRRIAKNQGVQAEKTEEDITRKTAIRWKRAYKNSLYHLKKPTGEIKEDIFRVEYAGNKARIDEPKILADIKQAKTIRWERTYRKALSKLELPSQDLDKWRATAEKASDEIQFGVLQRNSDIKKHIALRKVNIYKQELAELEIPDCHLEVHLPKLETAAEKAGITPMQLAEDKKTSFNRAYENALRDLRLLPSDIDDYGDKLGHDNKVLEEDIATVRVAADRAKIDICKIEADIKDALVIRKENFYEKTLTELRNSFDRGDDGFYVKRIRAAGERAGFGAERIEKDIKRATAAHLRTAYRRSLDWLVQNFWDDDITSSVAESRAAGERAEYSSEKIERDLERYLALYHESNYQRALKSFTCRHSSPQPERIKELGKKAGFSPEKIEEDLRIYVNLAAKINYQNLLGIDDKSLNNSYGEEYSDEQVVQIRNAGKEMKLPPERITKDISTSEIVKLRRMYQSALSEIKAEDSTPKKEKARSLGKKLKMDPKLIERDINRHLAESLREDFHFKFMIRNTRTPVTEENLEDVLLVMSYGDDCAYLFDFSSMSEKQVRKFVSHLRTGGHPSMLKKQARSQRLAD